MRIEELKSELRSGLAVANRYQVLFPALVSAPKPWSLNVMCDSVTIPGRQILTQERFTSSKAIKVPYGYANEDITISFLVSNDWYTHDWLRYMQDAIMEDIGMASEGGRRVRFKADYEFDFEIHTLNQNYQITGKTLVQNAFCTSMSSIELSNGSSENIRVTSTWAYDDWKWVPYKVPTKSVASTWVNPDAINPLEFVP